MMCCWNPNPFKRPTFSQLKTNLKGVLDCYSEMYESLSYVRPSSRLNKLCISHFIRQMDHQNIEQ